MYVTNARFPRFAFFYRQKSAYNLGLVHYVMGGFCLCIGGIKVNQTHISFKLVATKQIKIGNAFFVAVLIFKTGLYFTMHMTYILGQRYSSYI